MWWLTTHLMLHWNQRHTNTHTHTHTLLVLLQWYCDREGSRMQMSSDKHVLTMYPRLWAHRLGQCSSLANHKSSQPRLSNVPDIVCELCVVCVGVWRCCITGLLSLPVIKAYCFVTGSLHCACMCVCVKWIAYSIVGYSNVLVSVNVFFPSVFVNMHVWYILACVLKPSCVCLGNCHVVNMCVCVSQQKVGREQLSPEVQCWVPSLASQSCASNRISTGKGHHKTTVLPYRSSKLAWKSIFTFQSNFVSTDVLLPFYS